LFPILIPRFLVPASELYILIGMVRCRHHHLSRIQLLLAVVRAADLAVQGVLVAVLAQAEVVQAGETEEGAVVGELAQVEEETAGVVVMVGEAPVVRIHQWT